MQFSMPAPPLPGLSHNRTWLTYALALLPAALIYIYKAWLIYLDWALLCVITPLLIAAVLAIVAMVLFSRDFLVISICLLAAVISGLAPRPAPEQLHLALHRSEYQAVVQLARDHQLGHAGPCEYAYVLPDQYFDLGHTKDKCIFVEYDPALVVVFEPLFYRHLLVYAETPEAAKQYISCGGSDGVLYYELEPNWYECLEDWN